jgi:hypothetical protein
MQGYSKLMQEDYLIFKGSVNDFVLTPVSLLVPSEVCMRFVSEAVQKQVQF